MNGVIKEKLKIIPKDFKWESLSHHSCFCVDVCDDARIPIIV
jgi:hypothetical protein